MAGSAKLSKVGINLNGNDLIRPKLTTTTLLSSGEIGYNGTFVKFYSGGVERTIGGTGTNALRLDEFKAPNTSVSFNSQRITNLATPVSDSDSATKGYVDAVVSGLDPKASVRVTTTSALPAVTYNNGTGGVGATLTANANGALSSQDSVTLVVGDRILVKDQVATLQNGIYEVTQVGDGSNPFILTRTTDADDSPDGEVTSGMFTFVEEGSSYADTGWVLATNNPIVIGTTGLSFTQFSSAGVVSAGDGLTQTGNTIDVVSGNTGITVNANDISLNLASPSGLTISSGLAIDDSIAGSGLTVTGKVLAVGAGNGITVNANDVTLASTVAGNGLTYTTGVIDVVSGNSAIVTNANDITLTLASGSGLEISSGLKVASTIAGNGLTLTSGVLDIVSGNSAIVANANDITLTLAANSGLTISSGLAVDSAIAGNGLTFTSGVLDIGAGTGITVNANDVAINTSVVARKYIDSSTITGDDTTTDFAITHSLSNQFVSVTVIDETTLEDVIVDIERTSTSVATVKFAVAPATGENYTVLVIG